MHLHDSARAITTKATLLSGQVDGLLSAWELAIANGDFTASPTPGRQLLDLKAELAAIDRTALETRSQAEKELKQATAWEAKALLARREGREDLVARATQYAVTHRNAQAAFENEADALGESLRGLHRALAVVEQAATAGPIGGRADI